MAVSGTAMEGADRLGRLTQDEAAGIRDVVALLVGLEEGAEALAMSTSPEAGAPHGEDTPKRQARRRERWDLLRRGLEANDITDYLAEVQEEARDLASRGHAFATVVRWMTRPVPALQTRLVETCGHDGPRLVRALNGLNRLVSAVISTVGAEYADMRESMLEQEHRRILRELSVPVVSVWEGVLVVPLVGVLDSTRAREMTQTLLESVSEKRVRVVILDITGVPAVDTQVADHLIRTVKAARLLGTQSVLVGIRPVIAQTLVRLGVDLESVHTEADLQSGLLYAFELLGYRIVRDPDHG